MNMEFQAIPEEKHVGKFFEDAKIRAKLSACQSAPQLKDESLASTHRLQGNASFRSRRYTAALQQYGRAVLTAATADTLSSALANRSAALYHLRRYQDSLRDMTNAMDSGYPSDRHHKLHVRRARCHLALGRPSRAAAALSQYRAALDSLGLGPAAREKLTSEADSLLAEIERAAAGTTEGDREGGPAVGAGEDEESSTPRPAPEGGAGPGEDEESSTPRPAPEGGAGPGEDEESSTPQPAPEGGAGPGEDEESSTPRPTPEGGAGLGEDEESSTPRPAPEGGAGPLEDEESSTPQPAPEGGAGPGEDEESSTPRPAPEGGAGPGEDEESSTPRPAPEGGAGPLEDEESSTPRPTPEGGAGALVGASSCLQLRQTEQKGRHVVTTRSVQKGAVLFAEEPYCCVLLPERRLDHCHHCIRHTHALLPCRRCRDVGYCSATCRDAADAAYHRAECGQAAFLEAFGIGRAAVRVVLTAGWTRLEALRRQLADVGASCRAASCSCHRPDGDRYLAVFHLVHHLDGSHPEDAYHYGRAAATLAAFLAERTAFFGPVDGSGPPEPALRWAAALLLRHILQLVCNAHAPTKLVPLPSDGDGDGDGGVVQLSEQRIATAIYPSASYMNHSCDPSIINSFWGSTLIVRSVKPLSAGAEVFHCYGPHFARGPPAERRRQLLEQYHFSCDCEHCSRPELAHHLELLNSLLCRGCGGGTLPAEGKDSSGERRRCLDCRLVHSYQDRLDRLRQIEDEAERVADSGGRAALSRLDTLLQEAGCLARPTHETLFIVRDLRAKLCSQIGEPALALQSLRPNLASVAARYGGDSVELGNLLLTATDVLLLACHAAGTAERRRELVQELQLAIERGLAIFSIHYGEWSPAYRDLCLKMATVRQDMS